MSDFIIACLSSVCASLWFIRKHTNRYQTNNHYHFQRMMSLQEPSESQREAHNPTHLPRRTWCGCCVQVNGEDNHHKVVQAQGPVVQVDLALLKDEEGGESTCLFWADVISPTCTLVKLHAFEVGRTTYEKSGRQRQILRLTKPCGGTWRIGIPTFTIAFESNVTFPWKVKSVVFVAVLAAVGLILLCFVRWHRQVI